MFFRRCCVAIVSFVLVFPAFAAKPEMPPMPVAQQLPVELRLVQQEMDVDVADAGTAVAAGVGGILGALIGAAVNKAAVSNAEKRVAELRTKLVGYPFNQHFETELRRNFSVEGLSPDPQFKVEHTVFAINDSSGQSAPGNGILVVSPHYTMSQDFERMKVAVAIHYVDRYLDRKNRLQQKARFARNYAWVYEMPKISGSGASEDAARWTQLSGERLAAMLDQGIAQVVALINYDFSAAGRAQAVAKKRGDVAVPAGDVAGLFVSGQGNTRVVRTGLGWTSGLTGYVSADAPLAVATAVAATTTAPAATASGEAAAPTPEAMTQVVPPAVPATATTP